MKEFSQKLQLVYSKLFDNNIDKFTEAFIDYEKFKKDKNTQENFFTNRKIVLRRWLIKDTSCTFDFQKSFKNYKIAHYKLGTEPLFLLEDFKTNTLTHFQERLSNYIQQKQRAYINTNYKYIYKFNELQEKIEHYEIKNWIKSKEDETIIELLYNKHMIQGTFAFHDNNNIFITMKIDKLRQYLLFHDNNDSNSNYLVGTSMGYLPLDHKVPYAHKAILAKELLDKDNIDLQFILNEIESISAIENRYNPNLQEIKINPFIRYNNQFKKYHKFFSRLASKKFKKNFYYRLAFKEFYAIKELFKKVSNKESYFIFNHNKAFLELIKTLEEIRDTKLHIVMEFKEKNIFLETNYKVEEIKNRFFKLSTHGIETTIIFVINSLKEKPSMLENVYKEISKHNIKIKLVQKNTIVNEVNSLDFAFIHIGDQRDFVLADPLRDSKDVFKLFIDEVTMEEYRIDYRKILDKSI